MFELAKIKYIEIILFVLICSLLFLFVLKKNKEGFINQKQDIVIHTENDIFDDYYSKMHDKLLLDDAKVNFEINHIFQNPNSNQNQNKIKTYNVLDVGCGTGHHINKMTNLNIKCIGIDTSKSMILKSQKKFPKSKFKLADAMTSLEFPEHNFSHILCLHFTIYYFKDKRRFLENCFHWLKPNGLLILHLVNIKKFNIILPNAKPFIKSHKKTNQNVILFNKLKYRSKFINDANINFNTLRLDEPNVIFKEIFNFEDTNKIRINEHKLYMSSQNAIINCALEVGFMLKTYAEINVDTCSYNYLYTLEKPN
jgi:ubiquinone/menaquinone biosynthesis C-methylase UbiE